MSNPSDPVDFAASARRRDSKPGPEKAGAELDAAQHWERALQVHGASLRDPAVAAAATGISELLERLIYAGLRARYGDASRGIPGDENDGIDHTGAQVFIDLIYGLRDAAGHLREHDAHS
ncbi:hypothetical protein [Kitasatospora sp. NPDC057223]|uniref:hypothetical protein n=1 Tax=Kitasatospora sp. NPDC057223 TaxID=3346055 RepID=UPI00363909FF